MLTKNQMIQISLSSIILEAGVSFAKGVAEKHVNQCLMLPDGRKFGVNSRKGLWVDEKTGRGGADSISLTKYLLGLDYFAARDWLSDHFGSRELHAGCVERGGADFSSHRDFAVVEAEDMRQPVQVDIDESTWCFVRAYLIEQRRLDEELIEFMNRTGQIASDARANAIFRREFAGAFKRGTTTGSTFKQTIGNSYSGTFVVQGSEPGVIAVVESPIDALSLHMKSSILTCIATGGNSACIDSFSHHLLESVEIYAAHDADEAGDRQADLLMTSYPSASRWRPPQPYKDWNEIICS